MPNIEFGPPGHKGVTQIMGLGSTEILQVIPASEKPMRDVALGAAAVWAGGTVLGSNTMKNIAVGALLGVFMIRAMMKARAGGAAQAPAIATVQGWGAG